MVLLGQIFTMIFGDKNNHISHQVSRLLDRSPMDTQVRYKPLKFWFMVRQWYRSGRSGSFISKLGSPTVTLTCV